MSQAVDQIDPELAKALVEAQKDFGRGVALDGEVNFDSKGASKARVEFKYPTASGVCAQVREALNKHGLAPSAGVLMEVDRKGDQEGEKRSWMGTFSFDLIHESGAVRQYLRLHPIVVTKSFGQSTQAANTSAFKYWLMDLMCVRGVDEAEVEHEGKDEKRTEADALREAAESRAEAQREANRAQARAADNADPDYLSGLRALAAEAGYTDRAALAADLNNLLERNANRGFVAGLADVIPGEAETVKNFFRRKVDERARVEGDALPEAKAPTGAVPAAAPSTTTPANPTGAASPASGAPAAGPATSAATGGKKYAADAASCKHPAPDKDGFCWACGTAGAKAAGSLPPGLPPTGKPAPTSTTPASSGATATSGNSGTASAPSGKNCASDPKLAARFSAFAAEGKAARTAAGIDVPGWQKRIMAWAKPAVIRLDPEKGLMLDDIDEAALGRILAGFGAWKAAQAAPSEVSA